MRPSLWALFMSPVVGINLRRSDAPRVLGFDFARSTAQRAPLDGYVNVERDTAQATLDNDETLYYINVTIGTPPQPFSLQLDTGSSDLWVNTASSSLCRQRQEPCSTSGTYSAGSSSTHQTDTGGIPFNITYADGSGATGPYAKDTLRVAGQTVEQYRFGIGQQSSLSQGVLGIGYPANEVQVSQGGGVDTYRNLPQRLVADGVIASSAYSLWLNDLDAATGSVLFGGVDRAKFSGELGTVPVQKTEGVYSAFFIKLTGLNTGSSVVTEGLPANVLLDSGSTLAYLPNDVVRPLYDDLDAFYESSQGVALVSCSLRDRDDSLTFRFGDAVSISVLYSEIVFPTGSSEMSAGGDVDICVLGISPSGDGGGVNVLGDAFLRSAYVVYDLANNEISLAQSNYNATGSDVVEIGTGPDAVPSVTGTTPTSTGVSEDDDSLAPLVAVPSRWYVVVAAWCILAGFAGFLA